MNKQRINFLHIIELLFAIPFVFILPIFPRFLIISISKSIGKLCCLTKGRDYKVSMANLDLVFGDSKSHKEKQKITAASFSSFILTVMDMIWFSFLTKKRINKHVINMAALEALTEQGAVTVTGHIGNWELLAKTGAMFCKQLVTIAAPSKNRYIDKLISKLRTSEKLIMIPKRGALKQLLKALKNEETIAIAADQNTLPKNGGTYVNFLGVPAPITRAPFLLAEKTGKPIFVGYCIPTEKYKYKIYLSKPYYITEKQSEEKVTEAVIKELEKTILEHPEFWLWMYKKWKYIPKSMDESKYPFCAKRHNREKYFDTKDNM
jgi:Kdo2-lipid IVA lauroyltransferase/acyltransferase